VTPELIQWPRPHDPEALEGSRVEILHSDGRAWLVGVDSGRIVVQNR
jgi:hypothetical protein